MKKITAGIVAHVDAGKTTLAEELLFRFGTIRNKGRVDHGDTLLDDAAVERERGITVFSSGASFAVGDTFVTLLDTPGHVDFSSETERTFSVLDLVILVVSAPEGVEAHTRTLFDLAKRYSLPVWIFVTKCDLERRGADEVTAELKREFGQCVSMERADGIYTNAEDIASCDEELLESYVEHGELSDGAVCRAVAERKLFPVACPCTAEPENLTETAMNDPKEDSHEFREKPSVPAPAQRRHDAGNTGGKTERQPPDDLKMGNGHGESRDG